MATPELALMGYLPRDLLMSQGFVRRGCEKLSQIAKELKDAPPLLVGVATPNPSDVGRPLYNSAVLLQDGSVGPAFHKSLLPTYDVFDEDRYFEPYQGTQILELNGVKLGISICEDVWNDRDFWHRRRYHQDPIEALAKAGAEAIVNLSASPFHAGKHALRERMLGHMAKKYGLPVVIVNQVGANDDLIFDGRSAAFDAEGRLFARAKGFEEDVLLVDLPAGSGRNCGRRFHGGIRNLERAGAGGSRLRAQDAVPQGAAGTFGRHRFGVDGGDRGGCDGAGERAGRDDALDLFEPGQRGRFGGTGAQPGDTDHGAADRRHHEDLRRGAGGRLRGFAGGRYGREYSIAHSRQSADGAL